MTNLEWVEELPKTRKWPLDHKRFNREVLAALAARPGQWATLGICQQSQMTPWRKQFPQLEIVGRRTDEARAKGPRHVTVYARHRAES